MNRLRKLRRSKNLSLRELSEKVNISFSQIGKIERNESLMSSQQAQMFAAFFDVSIDYLLGSSDIPKPKSHQFTYYTDPLNFVSLEDIVKKYNHSDFMIIFNNDFIKLIFNDSDKAEVIYKRVKWTD